MYVRTVGIVKLQDSLYYSGSGVNVEAKHRLFSGAYLVDAL